MKKYLTPLWVFIGGNLCLLVALLFMPTIGEASANLSAQSANISDTFWKFGWAVSNTKFFVFLALEMAVLYSTAKAFLAVK